MKFQLDESADFPLAIHLRSFGHDVKAIAHEYPQALPDDEVLALARAEQRILITNDRDFGELIVRRHLSHSGVIYFRLGDEALPIKIAWLDYDLTEYADQLRHFMVITERGVRMRKTSYRRSE